jgi:hypothetical protein
MKSRIITGVFCILTIIFLLASLGHAQIAGSSVQPVNGPSYSVPDHPMHASQGDLRPEQSLLGSNGVTVARGERPLSDFPDDHRYVKPLGDVARDYRKEHATAEKAAIVWNQQGQ